MQKELLKKLNQIIDKSAQINNESANEFAVSDFETKYEIRIPNDFKDFILNFHEFYFKDDYAVKLSECSRYTPDDGYEHIDYLYSAKFIENAETYFRDGKKDFLPIGESTGDILLIGIGKDNYGKIFIEYHECADNEKRIFLVSNSFLNFIKSVEQHKKICKVNLDEIEVELADDL